ncbi:helix-turn-helix domain-containing protein [Nocardia concava]|uniref:helix-turn-helix domain-containing protein n=1 Tax=Nocardia concava TaxID=257281 RepID=UPI000316E38A|nr:helix-turn-helix domain-containing protein [Nocardia concava]
MDDAAHERSLLSQHMYTTGEVARILGVDASTVRRWRRSVPAEGPGFIQISERVAKYPESDLEAYLAARHIVPAA